MSTRFALLAPLLLASLAGCLGAGPADDDKLPRAEEGTPRPAIVPGSDVQPIAGDPLPWQPPHDHADPAQHAVEINMELLGRVPLDDPGTAAVLGGADIFGEIDVQGDWLVQCAGGRRGTLLYDVANRTAPRLAASMDSGGGRCADVKLTDDAAYAVVSGWQLWDLRDKEAPRKAFEDRTLGCHMCAIHSVGGEEYVFESIHGRGFAVVELQREPPMLVEVAEWGHGNTCRDPQDLLEAYVSPRAPDPDCLDIGQLHDVFVYDDPVLGKPVAAVAYWDAGVWLVDVSDPAAPSTLGRWNDFQGESGDVHTTSVDFLNVSGQLRRIVVASTETGPLIGPFSTLAPGAVYVLDATDVGDIRLVAKWTNPGLHPTGADPYFFPVGEYSAHNLQFEHGRVYLAHYHGGVWVLDVQAALDSPPPEALAHHAPGAVPSLGLYLTRDDGLRRPGNVWDVLLKDGYLYASDIGLGLFVLRFAGDPLNDAAYTSDA